MRENINITLFSVVLVSVVGYMIAFIKNIKSIRNDNDWVYKKTEIDSAISKTSYELLLLGIAITLSVVWFAFLRNGGKGFQLITGVTIQLLKILSFILIVLLLYALIQFLIVLITKRMYSNLLKDRDKEYTFSYKVGEEVYYYRSGIYELEPIKRVISQKIAGNYVSYYKLDTGEIVPERYLKGISNEDSRD